MLEAILLTSFFFCGTQATFDDMDDGDFASFLQVHTNFGEKFAVPAAKGCVGGAIKDGLKGGSFSAFCIGCATGAAANVGIQMTFPQLPIRD